MNKFIVLIRDEGSWENLSPAEIEATFKKYYAWAAKLRAEERMVDAAPLERGGRQLSGACGTITDGPYAETKEMIGGYYIYTAADMEEAVALARECPAMRYGGSIEIRQIAAMA